MGMYRTGGGGIVESGEVEGIMRELVAVEFNQVRVELLSQTPHNATWNFHLSKKKRVILPYLLERLTYSVIN